MLICTIEILNIIIIIIIMYFSYKSITSFSNYLVWLLLCNILPSQLGDQVAVKTIEQVLNVAKLN